MGAKEAGEGLASPTAPAIADAVYHATGYRCKDLPITPEKVLIGLEEAPAPACETKDFVSPVSDAARSQAPTTMRPRKLDDIVTVLRLRIQGRVYGRDERLPAERDLAPALGVARSTLRQALGALQEEGYLTRRLGAKGGWFVTDLAQPVAEWTEAMRANLHEVRDIIDYRIAVETRAAELAASRRSDDQLARMADTVESLAAAVAVDAHGRAGALVAERLRVIDDHFHALIAEAADNRKIQEAVQLARAELFATETRSTYREIAAGLPHDHRLVLDAISHGDPVAARMAMERHIRHGADVWLKNGRTAANDG